jgi:hypothetical protein
VPPSAVDPTARVAPAIHLNLAGRAVTSQDPLRVLVLGDGVAYDLQPTLAAALESGGRARVTPAALFGFGLTRTDVYDWRRLWAASMARTRPDVVIVFLGPWDLRTVTVEGRAIGPGRARWMTWYGQQVTDADRLLTPGRTRLIWVGATFEAAAGSAPQVTALDSVLRQVTRNEGDTYVNGAGVMTGPDGHFQRTEGASVLFKLDGEHLCQDGAARLAAAITTTLSRMWALAVNEEWRQGPWRSDPRYQGPGADRLPRPMRTDTSPATAAAKTPSSKHAGTGGCQPAWPR